MRVRLAGFGYAYLGCVVLSSAFTLGGAYQKVREAAPGEERPLAQCAEALAVALIVGLFCVPIRLLLGLFPEPSDQPMVRLLRRPLIGALVGPIPAMVVFMLGDHGSKLEELVPLSMGFGLLVGLMDTITRDQSERLARREREQDARG